MLEIKLESEIEGLLRHQAGRRGAAPASYALRLLKNSLDWESRRSDESAELERVAELQRLRGSMRLW
jgi:hypothetical protein